MLYGTWAEWWKEVKKTTAILGRWWGQEMARRKNEKAKRWSMVLCKAWQDKDEGKLRDTSEALRTHYEAEARAYLVQAGREALELDEWPTRYFFNSVRSRQQSSFVEGLKEVAVEVARSYYAELFQAREEVRGDLAEGFLDSVTSRLPEEEVGQLEE